MENELKLEFEADYFESHKIGSLLILELKVDGFQTLIDVQANMELLSWLDFIADEKSVKGLLIIGNEKIFGDEAYARHLSTIAGEIIKPDEPRLIDKFVDHRLRSIQVNMLSTFIKRFISFPKLVLSALTDRVVSPFWGLSLSMDYRIASPNFSVHLNSKEFGLHPSGGVPFFLLKSLGWARTQGLLYGEKYLDAETLLKFGLLNRITSPGNYRSDSIKIASQLLDSTSYEYYLYTKQLVNYNLVKEYDAYSNIDYRMEQH